MGFRDDDLDEGFQRGADLAWRDDELPTIESRVEQDAVDDLERRVGAKFMRILDARRSAARAEGRASVKEDGREVSDTVSTSGELRMGKMRGRSKEGETEAAVRESIARTIRADGSVAKGSSSSSAGGGSI